MKTKHVSLLVPALALFVSHLSASPLGTAFTYQGRLNDGGNPANGIYDLRLTLYDAESAAGAGAHAVCALCA